MNLGVRDIVFIVYRHKWKIILLSLLGFAAAAAVHFSQKPSYSSGAKLLVHYLVERFPDDSLEGQPEQSRHHVAAMMNAQVALIRSQDLALAAAEEYGPARIVPESGESATVEQAAGVIMGGLRVAMSSGSNILNVSFQHKDPEVARGVLSELVTRYFDRHLDIHRSIGAFGEVEGKRDIVRSKLRATEDELNKLKNDAGVINLDAAISILDEQLATTRRDLLSGKASLAEQAAHIGALEEVNKRRLPGPEEMALAEVERLKAKNRPKPDLEDIARYEVLKMNLQKLNLRRIDLLAKYTAQNRNVLITEEQIRQVDEERLRLVRKFPQLALAGMQIPEDRALIDLTNAKARQAALSARNAEIERQLQMLQGEHRALAEKSARILELERRKRIEEEMYTNLDLSLEKARADETLDPSKIPNISVVESPTISTRFYSDRFKKLIKGLALSGIVAGLGLAFLIELFLDRTVKRPQEVESRLHIPVMLAIPYVNRKVSKRRRLAMSDEREKEPPPWGELAGVAPAASDLPYLPGGPGEDLEFILPYATAIRDRIVYHFELNDLHHKPKLVALTGLSEGAGTTTIAMGLARSFAESGSARVLLVDLSSGMGATANGSANGNANGQSCSLDAAVQLGRGLPGRNGDDNLVLARVAPDGNGAMSSFAPKHLYDLLPELRSSDFDYIIFDMPPLAPTSPTVAMAGIMDQVLLVLEAESTNRESLRKYYADLTAGKPDVACVFNKRRKQNPRWLEGAV
ncbi:MAG: hypothetical protein HKN82_09415 [Akkermansiaceae bacterium]|nr:hypothetical protein [Akkermansiaceae bacterium]